jgi:NitT/TauT family transport system ATP-binding protein
MQRRVALARAFVNEPPLLLLDEPFISLDAPVANKLRDLLLDQWRARGATIVFVTHDLREAIQLGDRVLFMSASPGRVVLDIPVPLDRPREWEGRTIDAFRAQLLDEHPALLAGLEQSRLAEGEAVRPAKLGAA